MSSQVFLNALQNGDFDILRASFRLHPGWLTMQISWDKGGKLSGTPLHYAAFSGNAQLVTFLVNECKQDVNYTHGVKSNWAPIHHAAAGDSLVAIKTLLDLGADPCLIDVNGRAPLDLAKEEGVQAMLAKAVLRTIPELPDEREKTIWTKTSEVEVMSVRRTPDNVYRLTEIFNFETRRVTVLALELGSKSLAQNVIFFDQMSDRQMLVSAHDALRKLGGTPAPLGVYGMPLRGKPRLPKDPGKEA